MSDINPTLDRLAHGGGGMHLFDHHDRAAHHHEQAAEQHRLAAAAHRAGDTAGAAGYATQAWGHGAHAQQHANESLKGYAVTDSSPVAPDETRAATTSSSTRIVGGGPGTSDEPALGYTGGDTSRAPNVNPTAANTPGIR